MQVTGGIRGVLGAGRDCRYSGARRVKGASGDLGAFLQGVKVKGTILEVSWDHQGCRGYQGCIGGLAGTLGTQGPEGV